MALRALFILAFIALPLRSFSHAFDERYDLPIPLSFFIYGSMLIVASTYLVSLLFIKKDETPRKVMQTSTKEDPFLFRVSRELEIFVQITATFFLFFLIYLAFWGPKNPLMNLSSHFIWINWWIGMPLLFAIFGSSMHCLDPFNAVIGYFKKIPTRQSLGSITKLMNYLGRWPATLGLLCWGWIEVVYSNAAVPFYLGVLIVFWLVSGVIGSLLIGHAQWNENWNFFRIYFSYFGTFSPFYRQSNSVHLGRPFIELVQQANACRGNVAFVIAMLSVVLFDGLHSSQVWLAFEHLWGPYFDSNGYTLGFLGVVLVWGGFYIFFLVACFLVPQTISANARDKFSFTLYISEKFAPTLIPIALAYHLAHNFSSLIIQGQSAFILVSDPLDQGLDLFRTANFYPNISIVNAETVWYVALSSIVIGHMISILLAHLVALREFQSSVEASKACLPLTILMVLFTAVSLIILAEPLAV